MYMNELELKVYNKFIKPNLKIVDGEKSIDMDIYQQIQSEQVKSLFVSCLYKKQIKMLDSGKRDIIEEINEEAEEYFDDFSIMDDFIEEEILPLNRRDIPEEGEDYDLPYINGDELDNLYCSRDAKKYIEGLIDGYNFNIKRNNQNKLNNNDKIIYSQYSNKILNNYKLREELSSILEVLNPLERQIIKLKFDDRLSNKQIAILLHLSVKVVNNIYISAIVKIRNNKYTDDLRKYYK